MILRAHTNTQRGFTLIELMLALALLGLLMVMLYGSFSAVANSKVHAENRMLTEREGRAIIWQLSKEIRGAIQTPLVLSKTLLIGQGRMESGVPLDSITFSTADVAHRRSLNGFGTEDLVSYTAAPNLEHRGWFILMRGQTSALITQNPGTATTPPVVLADNVLGLHLRYFDGQRWLESWDSRNTPPGQVLPLAISVDLSMASPGGRPANFSTSIAVPMAFILR